MVVIVAGELVIGAPLPMEDGAADIGLAFMLAGAVVIVTGECIAEGAGAEAVGVVAVLLATGLAAAVFALAGCFFALAFLAVFFFGVMTGFC